MNMCWKCIIYVIRAFVLPVCSNTHTQTHKLARVQVAYAPESSCSLLSPMVSWYSARVWSSVTAHIVSTKRLCLISSWTHTASTHRPCVFLWTCAFFVCPHAAKKQINLRYTVSLYRQKQSVARATISFVILLSVKSVETHNNKSCFSLKPTVIAIYPSVSKPKESGTAYLCVLKDEYPKAGPIWNVQWPACLKKINAGAELSCKSLFLQINICITLPCAFMYKKKKEKIKNRKGKKLRSKEQNWAVAQTADKSAPCANPRATETDTLQGIVC